MVETLDAARALGTVDLSRRSELRAALATTLIKRADHRPAFDTLFDIYFAGRRSEPTGVRSASPPAAAGSADGDALVEPPAGDLLDALLAALRRDDREALRALAELAVAQFGGIDADRSASTRYYLYRVLRRLDLSNLLRRTVQHDHDGDDRGRDLADRLIREEQARRLDEFRRMIAGAIQERLVHLKGTREAASLYQPTLVEDVDFLTASATDLREMRRAVRPLARKLAARVAQQRRLRRRGRLDVRRSVRRSLSAGGVPLDPAFRKRRASRPDLYLLCDISGSVAEFARFTIALLHALTDELDRIRSFVFVDDIDEVTGRLADRSTGLDAARLLAAADVVGADGHSDYGVVFARFRAHHAAGTLGPWSTVIVTGDARNNYRDPGVAHFRAIAERARRVYWLDPEPRHEWNRGDSIIATYAPYCAGVFETRTLRQLAAFVHAVI
jgi:uncharacterized protein with von Willebrand factor type A (vWA) domain